MASYRFCRTDDIALLVNALNRCWAPYFPDEPLMTPAAFKRSIRDLQIWCSSCMVAFAGDEPIGVLIGAKRPSATLIQKIAVHPDHRRLGHGRHLLTSLGSKLAILGPARIIAEVSETFTAGCALFAACGFVQEARLTDYVFEPVEGDAREGDVGNGNGRFVIPITVDDLIANGLLAESDACWARATESLMARKDAIKGLAVASDERIEAFVLHADATPEPAPDAAETEIVALRSQAGDDDAGARHLRALLARLPAQGMARRGFRFSKVSAAETSPMLMERIGFRAAGEHLRFAARARSD